MSGIFSCGCRALGDTVLSLANMRSLLGCSRTSVLVVDDSPAMLRYLRVLLELERYQVETANNGAEALQRLKEGSPAAIVLLDVEMPGMDGLKTLRQLRRLRPDLKVIMCSGVEDPRTARRASQLGAQAFITKPVQHLYLSAAIERCLQATSSVVAPHRSLKANVVKMPSPNRR
jgi:CheY-like chemotaxis protein